MTSLFRISVSSKFSSRIFVCCNEHFSTTSLSRKCKIIDGKEMARELKEEVKSDVAKWVSLGNRRPQLTAIIVGDDPASITYVRNKMKAAAYTGISSETLHIPETISEIDLLGRIHQLNINPGVDGILVQLPVPPHIDERRVCNAVAPEKDVDGFHVVNVGRFCVNQTSLVPATPAGVIELIKRAGIDTFGKNAVVCGRSKNVGMPIAMLLHSEGDATTTICHRHTPLDRLRMYTKAADIIVSATGIQNLITADMVSEGVAVIDVGLTQILDEKTGRRRLVGDVDFKGVSEKASFITPVPGGVGPMTVAMLMKNTLKVARKEIIYDNCWSVNDANIKSRLNLGKL